MLFVKQVPFEFVMEKILDWYLRKSYFSTYKKPTKLNQTKNYRNAKRKPFKVLFLLLFEKQGECTVFDNSDAMEFFCSIFVKKSLWTFI